MNYSFSDNSNSNGLFGTSPNDYTALTAGRDFMTPDGLLVPRALGEAGLRQHTAILVGGMLIGNWPDHL